MLSIHRSTKREREGMHGRKMQGSVNGREKTGRGLRETKERKKGGGGREGGQTSKQTSKQTNKQTNKQTDRQRHKQTDKTRKKRKEKRRQRTLKKVRNKKEREWYDKEWKKWKWARERERERERWMSSKSSTYFIFWVIMEFFLVLQMIKSAHCTTTILTKKEVWHVYSRIFLCG